MRSVVVFLLVLAGVARAQAPATDPPPLAEGHYALVSHVKRPDRATRWTGTLTLVERRRGGRLWSVSRAWRDRRDEPPFKGPGVAVLVGGPTAPREGEEADGQETLWFDGVALTCSRTVTRAPDGSSRREWRCPQVPGGLVRAQALDPKGAIVGWDELMLLGPWRVRPYALRAAPGQWTLHRESRWRDDGRATLVWRWVEERDGALWRFQQDVGEDGAPLDEALAYELPDPDDPRATHMAGLASPEVVAVGKAYLPCLRQILHADEACFVLRSYAVPLDGLVEVRGLLDTSTLVAWGFDGPRSTGTPLALPVVAHDALDLIRTLGSAETLKWVCVRRGGSVRVERGKLLVQETTLGQERVREQLRWLRASHPPAPSLSSPGDDR